MPPLAPPQWWPSTRLYSCNYFDILVMEDMSRRLNRITCNKAKSVPENLQKVIFEGILIKFNNTVDVFRNKESVSGIQQGGSGAEAMCDLKAFYPVRRLSSWIFHTAWAGNFRISIATYYKIN